MHLPKIAPAAPLALSGIALALLIVAPFGSRFGWWQYGFGLYRLMPASGLLAAAAFILSLLILVRERRQLAARSIALLAVALVLSAALVYVPWRYVYIRRTLPAIHDITTDLDHPPTFSAVLSARAAERANRVDDRSPELAQQQKAAYPDVGPLVTPLPVGRAFNEALLVAQSMPGWTVVASDAGTGRIEAFEQSRWFRFNDDVVIRVTSDGAGSRIDMRSTSRQGVSDYGVNAARIREYFKVLSRRIG